MAASMSSSFLFISLSVARICWSTLDSFTLGWLLSFFAADVRLPIIFSLSGRCSCGRLGRRSSLWSLRGAPRALVLRVAKVNGRGRGFAHQAGVEGDEPDHQPRDGPFEVHGALVVGSVL